MLFELLGGQRATADLAANLVWGLRDRGLQGDTAGLVRNDVIAAIVDLNDIADAHVESFDCDGQNKS